ncbi:transketolase [Candidatus Cerribacteria bacterium 'Amazon FNV 2010 28 9']|uniref:Transketolase n=1 Tax=Candidatus Cerribacteria bacterium 'Amazon FNV 2010 28 9' TaxID=2081795 RepID=A0A317JNV2_9BACT|nr:MAG: transketolase [Candidatus Cerribacteria bacterium 'Amazon FNV 2010 28 9']
MDATLFSQAAIEMRRRIITMTSKAGSGHMTSSLSCVELLIVLFSQFIHYDPIFPNNIFNDRFILSKGHAAPALYALYSLAGWIHEDELESLRERGSRLEGHPTRRLPFIDVATGSLGQGLAVGIGEAIGLQRLDPQPHVFVMLGDGEMAEGSVWEAMAVGAKHDVSNIVAIVDCNRLGQSGESIIGSEIETLAKRTESFGWKTKVIDGHDLIAIDEALKGATSSPGPHMILAKTIKGKGYPLSEDKEGWHAKVLNTEELAKALEHLGAAQNIHLQVQKPQRHVPISRKPSSLRVYSPAFQNPTATKMAFGKAVESIVSQDRDCMVIDGDVKNSTMTQGAFVSYPAQAIESYIVEQTMMGMATGLDVVGKTVIVSTFAAFLTRAFDQLRMAALSSRRIIVNGSYAGVSIGKDGASQMGLEDIAMMRTLPESVVVYPSDAYSAYALLHELYSLDTLSYIRTTREPTPLLYGPLAKFPLGGSHIHGASDADQVTIIAAGITLFEALKAQQELSSQGVAIRVIDAYSIKPLDCETISLSVHQTHGRVIVVEDHRQQGGLGEAVLSGIAGDGQVFFKHLCVHGIPGSAAPQEELQEHHIDVEAIVRAVRGMV